MRIERDSGRLTWTKSTSSGRKLGSNKKRGSGDEGHD